MAESPEFPGDNRLDARLTRITGVPFYNTSNYSFEKLIRRFNLMATMC